MKAKSDMTKANPNKKIVREDNKLTFRNGQHLSGCRLSNESFTFGPAIQASNVTVGSSLKPMESNFVQANAGPDTHAGLVGLLVLNFGA